MDFRDAQAPKSADKHQGVLSALQENSRCFASSVINRCEVPKTSGNHSFNVEFKGTVAKRVANVVEHLTAASP